MPNRPATTHLDQCAPPRRTAAPDRPPRRYPSAIRGPTLGSIESLDNKPPRPRRAHSADAVAVIAVTVENPAQRRDLGARVGLLDRHVLRTGPVHVLNAAAVGEA